MVSAIVLAAGCAGADGTERGAIRENVVEPGITAIDQSRTLACNSELTTLQAAMQSYELLEGEPAPNEAALVEAEYLRSESELWDIEDGQIVSVDPACDAAP